MTNWMNINEAQLYNLMSGGGRDCDGGKDTFVEMMVLHLHRDHGYGPRKIAQSLKIKQKYVTTLLKMHEEEQ